MAANKTITKEDLAEQLAKEGRLQKGEALRDVEIVFAEIAKGLVDADYGTVKIAGFGSFSISERPSRVGVNPSKPTEKIDIPPTKVVRFKPSKTLKDFINAK